MLSLSKHDDPSCKRIHKDRADQFTTVGTLVIVAGAE